MSGILTSQLKLGSKQGCHLADKTFDRLPSLHHKSLRGTDYRSCKSHQAGYITLVAPKI